MSAVLSIVFLDAYGRSVVVNKQCIYYFLILHEINTYTAESIIT